MSRNGYVRKFYERIKTATGDGVVDRIFIRVMMKEKLIMTPQQVSVDKNEGRIEYSLWPF